MPPSELAPHHRVMPTVPAFSVAVCPHDALPTPALQHVYHRRRASLMERACVARVHKYKTGNARHLMFWHPLQPHASDRNSKDYWSDAVNHTHVCLL